MKIFRYWATQTVEIDGTNYRLRDGSNDSPAAAAAKLAKRADLLNRFSGGLSRAESDSVREALLDLGGRTTDGGYEAVICEEIVDELAPHDIVTRNRYGAEVLNSEDTCFIDVDCVRKSRSLAARLARPVSTLLAAIALFAATIRWVGRYDIGPAAGFAMGVILIVMFTLAMIVFFRAAFPAFETPERAEATLLAKIQALAESSAWRGLAARVYRTAAGFRVLAQADGLAPGNRRFRALARALDADPCYVDLCAKQGCWRARLTPKPERIGLHRPPREMRFPRPPEAEPVFAAWVSDYVAASADYAVCRLLETVGRFQNTPAIRFHDERTCCEDSSPLA